MVPWISAAAGSRQQLDGFQAVLELHVSGAVQKRRQIPGERHARHLRSVSMRVVDAPARYDRMEITAIESSTQERMTAADTRVKEADVRNTITAGREVYTGQQLCEPFLLLIRPQRAEELGGLLGSPKLCDAVERENGALHLLQGRGHQQHAALGKEQVAGRHPHLLRLGSFSKRRDHHLPILPDRQPNLPPE